MEECFRCGQEKEDFMLCEAICKEGIRKICRDCIEKDEFPVIKKISEKEAEEKNKDFGIIRSTGSLLAEKQPMRRLVDKDLLGEVKRMETPEGLIENFHWIIMRKRRNLKLTRRQLAEDIGESESDIIHAESGNLPKGNYPFLAKLEKKLNVKLMEDNYRDRFKTVQRTDLDSGKYSGDLKIGKNVEDLTIDDLKKIKKEKELFEEEGSVVDDLDNILDDDISPEEIDKIIYGK